MSVTRVVAILGERQGSGVLLTPRSVLTCAHVVGATDRPAIAHPGRADTVTAEVQWRDDTLDAALLVTDHDILAPEVAAPLGRLRIGALATEAPLPHCEIVGFPDIQRYGADGALELDQYRATVLPAAGALRSALVCELNHPAAAERADGTSPLQGLSGSPVFAGAVLLGIVTQVPRGRGHLRVEGVPATRILEAGGPLNSVSGVERVTEVHPQDERFCEQYAKAVKARYRKTRIFGIDELGTHEATWDLDTAYLSLEAGGLERPSGLDRTEPHRPSPVQPSRIDNLLADRPRTLLRGEAGAGKTTLVWWLAAHAACGTLGPELADLNGLVPFVVPLRTVHARGNGLPTPSQLSSVAQVLTDDPPTGWARRVLESGRGFLLVDGVDELPPDEREHTQVWLNELLDLYPATRCLATVRPLAVEEEWLRSGRFDELQLLPMRHEDIQAFVTAWHRAAHLECDTYTDERRAESERAELATLETDLQAQFAQNRALRTLAQTPLLCAVICALHRRRGGLLPDTRWELYRSTLAMLLGTRDKQRGIANPDGITMGFEEHLELLQSLAVWLVRGGQAQLSREGAEGQIKVAMRRLSQVRSQGSPKAVLTHLLNRSGLLQERADDEIQFIHRTFQDYLAARAFVEGGSLTELLRNAHNEQWQDTVLLAVGHCRPAEVRELIEGLLRNGEGARERAERMTLYTLAARCLLGTVVVDESVSQSVAAGIRALLPPANSAEVEAVASLEEYVLPLLPEQSELNSDGVVRMAELLCRIGGADAIPYAKQLARRGSRAARSELVEGWGNFPVEEYASEVLAGLSLAEEAIPVKSIDQLRLLRGIAPFGTLMLQGNFTGLQLTRHLADVEVRHLSISKNTTLTDLSFVQRLPLLKELSALYNPALTKFSSLKKTHIELLNLSLHGVTQAQLAPIRHIPELTALLLEYPSTLSTRSLPRAHPGVIVLDVMCGKRIDLSTLRLWPALRALTLHLDSCTWLVHGRRGTTTPAPQITSLELHIESDYAGLEHVAEAFPALAELTLNTLFQDGEELDLTPLHGLPGLRITVSSKWSGVLPVLLGTEPLGDRLTVDA
ncbi:NACHT domain-containing protein [Streptomyces sp. JV176]|uniref:NACHT domain-containing protein n=1 Tax=Streptomyces sp. JV176 TaxID=858630 RepID=UPI002E764676|nr:NACHT domain-containing protein [Streptomyces sp. JV176]MEE1797908.1 NACHT domain-containing protein [Streptomyces sp. JV176]